MPSLSKFNSPIQDIVFSSFKIKKEVLDEDRRGIRWVSLANYDLHTAVDVIKDAIIDQQQPKNIIIQVLQKYIGDFNIQHLIDHMYEIYQEATKQTKNKVAFGTALFIPADERFWGMYGLFNKECQILNEKMNIPRVNLHRSIMSQVSEEDWTLRVRPGCWEEYQLGLSIGSTLSYEGMINLLRYIQTVFDTVFSTNSLTLRGKAPRVKIPPSLARTPGYYDNDFMYQVLEEKRIVITRSRSTGNAGRNRLMCTDQRLPGWRYWKVYKDNGPLWNFNCREGFLDAHLQLYNKSDVRPVWSTNMEIAEEPEADRVVENASDEDRTLEVVLSESEDEESAPKDCEKEKGNVAISSEEDEDSVFLEESQPVRVRSQRTKDSEKEKRENSYESEESNNRAIKLLKIAKDKVKDSERMLTIANEKIKSYKKDLSVKDAQLVKEKAAVRFWRDEVDKKHKEYDDTLSELFKLQVKLKHVEDEKDRIVREYDFLRNTFECEREDKPKVKVTRKFK